MFSVIKNVFGSFQKDAVSLSKDEAIEICSDIIQESHGGEAYVVTNETSHIIDGEPCNEATFVAYGVDGDPFIVNRNGLEARLDS